MSKEAVDRVITRMASDESFRKEMQGDAEAALRGYDLTPDEKKLLAAPEAEREAMALDDRTSKSAGVMVNGKMMPH